MGTVRVVISGNNNKNISSEDKLRTNITIIMFYCRDNNRDKLDVAKLHEAMQKLKAEDINIEQALDEFVNMQDKSKQLDILYSCTEESISKTLEDMIKEMEEPEKYVYTLSDKYTYSESELRKRIKYCKNPMEKQRLQRELSSINFMEGKHRRGRKK